MEWQRVQVPSTPNDASADTASVGSRPGAAEAPVREEEGEGEGRRLRGVGADGRELAVGSDEDPMVNELLRDVFASEADESEDDWSRVRGGAASWQKEMLREVFAHNALTRRGAQDSLRDLEAARGTGGGRGEVRETWELEMQQLFGQSPLTRTAGATELNLEEAPEVDVDSDLDLGLELGLDLDLGQDDVMAT
jgi:hypothetical protein